MRVTFKKDAIAFEQLNCAIELFLDQQFIPAITLAGASEEIYGRSVTLRGHHNALDLVKDFVLFHRHPKGKSEKQVRDSCNRVRNGLKHGAEGTIVFNPELEAFLLISRAIENYLRFGKARSDLMHQFHEATRNIG